MYAMLLVVGMPLLVAFTVTGFWAGMLDGAV